MAFLSNTLYRLNLQKNVALKLSPNYGAYKSIFIVKLTFIINQFQNHRRFRLQVLGYKYLDTLCLKLS